MGKIFAAGTLLSTIVYPLIIAVFEQLPLGTLFPEDKLTCAIFCGVLAGFGIGIVVHAVGATMLDIETGYEGKAQKAVLCILYAKRYPAIRDAVLKLDPKAFIVTTEVKNVNGKGYTLARNLEEKIEQS